MYYGIYHDIYACICLFDLYCQGQSRMTYEGTWGSAIGQRDKGKHVLDIPSSSVEGRMARGSAAAGP